MNGRWIFFGLLVVAGGGFLYSMSAPLWSAWRVGTATPVNPAGLMTWYFGSFALLVLGGVLVVRGLVRR